MSDDTNVANRTLKLQMWKDAMLEGTGTTPSRTLYASGLGKSQGLACYRSLRGQGWRGKGGCHPGHHGAGVASGFSRRRSAGSLGSREKPNVHAAVHAAFSGGGRGRDL